MKMGQLLRLHNTTSLHCGYAIAAWLGQKFPSVMKRFA